MGGRLCRGGINAQRSRPGSSTRQSVASKLSTITAGLAGFEFRESPFRQEPPPPQIPSRRISRRCGERERSAGLTRTKWSEPSTGHRSWLGFNTLPGGDSQLYFGNDKYGFLHPVLVIGDISPTTQSAPRLRIRSESSIDRTTIRLLCIAIYTG
jgi:hypothetical protein